LKLRNSLRTEQNLKNYQQRLHTLDAMCSKKLQIKKQIELPNQGFRFQALVTLKTLIGLLSRENEFIRLIQHMVWYTYIIELLC
jgi:hypothetical protein